MILLASCLPVLLLFFFFGEEYLLLASCALSEASDEKLKSTNWGLISFQNAILAGSSVVKIVKCGTACILQSDCSSGKTSARN